MNPDFPLITAREDYQILDAWSKGAPLTGINGDLMEIAVIHALDEIDRLRMVAHRLQKENTQLRNVLAATRGDLAKAQLELAPHKCFDETWELTGSGGSDNHHTRQYRRRK